MHELEPIRTTALARRLGGLPTFHDGFLRKVVVEPEKVMLWIDILADNNERLKEDTRVRLTLHGVQSFELVSKEVEDNLFIIHDLDFKRETHQLRMRLESVRGAVSEFVFETIELNEAKEERE